jgi:hypothetical protein
MKKKPDKRRRGNTLDYEKVVERLKQEPGRYEGVYRGTYPAIHSCYMALQRRGCLVHERTHNGRITLYACWPERKTNEGT